MWCGKREPNGAMPCSARTAEQGIGTTPGVSTWAVGSGAMPKTMPPRKPKPGVKWRKGEQRTESRFNRDNPDVRIFQIIDGVVAEETLEID